MISLIILSAVTIFSNDIEIAILDQNRKKIEWMILPTQSYDFHESKKVRLMTDVSRLHCTLQNSRPVVSGNMDWNQKWKAKWIWLEISKYVTAEQL